MNDNWANEKLSFRDSDDLQNYCFKNEFKFRKSFQHPTQKFYKELKKILKDIPDNASISSSKHIFPHVIKTKWAVTNKKFKEPPDYIMIDSTDSLVNNVFMQEYEYKGKIEGYKLIFEKENKLFVFKKIITKKIGT